MREVPGFVELAQSRELRAGDRAALLAAVAEVTRRRQVTLTLILTLTLTRTRTRTRTRTLGLTLAGGAGAQACGLAVRAQRPW